MKSIKLAVNIVLSLSIGLVFFCYFSQRDIYRAINKAQSEYSLWMYEHKVDTELFVGPIMTIGSNKSLTFTWESKDFYQGQKLTKSITVPRSVFKETEVTGMGPWIEWFKAKKKN